MMDNETKLNVPLYDLRPKSWISSFCLAQFSFYVSYKFWKQRYQSIKMNVNRNQEIVMFVKMTSSAEPIGSLSKWRPFGFFLHSIELRWRNEAGQRRILTLEARTTAGTFSSAQFITFISTEEGIWSLLLLSVIIPQ